MARPEVNQEIYMKLLVVNPGDKVLLKTGEIAEFVALKQKNFEGIMNGKRYNIFINSFDKVIEKASDDEVFDKLRKREPKQVQEKDQSKVELYKTFKKGDWCYINKSGKAILFIFDRIERNKVIGINPIDNREVRIDNTFEFGKVPVNKSL